MSRCRDPLELWGRWTNKHVGKLSADVLHEPHPTFTCRGHCQARGWGVNERFLVGGDVSKTGSVAFGSRQSIFDVSMGHSTFFWYIRQNIYQKRAKKNEKSPSLRCTRHRPTSMFDDRRSSQASESQQGLRYQLAGGDAALAPDLSFLSVETVRVQVDPLLAKKRRRGE